MKKNKPMGYTEAINFIAKRGIEQFTHFLRELHTGNNVNLANEFNITRERVRQLKNLWLAEVHHYTPKTGVLLALKECGLSFKNEVAEPVAQHHVWHEFSTFRRCLDCGLEILNKDSADGKDIDPCSGLAQMTFGKLLSEVQKYNENAMGFTIHPELARMILHEVRASHTKKRKKKVPKDGANAHSS